jgi:hypothetical protein
MTPKLSPTEGVNLDEELEQLVSLADDLRVHADEYGPTVSLSVITDLEAATAKLRRFFEASGSRR